jgi:hypothetical protein
VTRRPASAPAADRRRTGWASRRNVILGFDAATRRLVSPYAAVRGHGQDVGARGCAVRFGVAARVYQMIWKRMLGLVFGVTVYAASTVLTTFIAGLALGSPP